MSKYYFKIQRTTICIGWWDKNGINSRTEGSASAMANIT